jgi:uncharacterized membrane protein YfcA
MLDLGMYQYLLIALLFVWSGIVRSGFGFGGAVFSLPFLLLIDNQPLVFLPIIAVHLLFFSFLTVYQNQHKNRRKIVVDGAQTPVASTVDWSFLRRALSIMIVPKMIGVFGLLTLPPEIMSLIIFAIIVLYALSYVLNKPFQSRHKNVDVFFLMLGGYVSGTSLIGAPLIAVVFVKHVAKEQLRDTLFVLWFILVVIKMSSFIYYGVDLQWIHHLWLLPCAAMGHVIGLRLHAYLMATDTVRFYRLFGIILLLASVAGIAKEWG